MKITKGTAIKLPKTRKAMTFDEAVEFCQQQAKRAPVVIGRCTLCNEAAEQCTCKTPRIEVICAACGGTGWARVEGVEGDCVKRCTQPLCTEVRRVGIKTKPRTIFDEMTEPDDSDAPAVSEAVN